MRLASGRGSAATTIIERPDLGSALQVQRGQLKVVRGSSKGQTIEIRHPGVVVGAAPECALQLDDPAVSRQQFAITPTQEGFRLRDLGSKNGTFVGGLLVHDVTLAGSQEISVGQTRLRFKTLDSCDEFPLSDQTAFGPLLGRSVAMRQLFALLERAAPQEVTVLLEGESGTGKELAARALHAASSRSASPFAVVDCGAVQASLVESELFGHKKGAFTGASSDRAGVFEAARGGTVLLDEIGELDLALQPKLLRLLEQREVRRLGENTYRQVDVRLIAATNRELTREVEQGRFREDLFYRLSVVRVRIPPLRERQEDIGLLARTFVQAQRPELDPLEVISDRIQSMLLSYDWPGNVRELRNVVERLLIFPEAPEAAIGGGGSSRRSEPAAGPSEPHDDLLQEPFHQARQRWNDRFERFYLTACLDRSGGVVAQAARQAEIPRQTFHRLLSKHRIAK